LPRYCFIFIFDGDDFSLFRGMRGLRYKSEQRADSAAMLMLLFHY